MESSVLPNRRYFMIQRILMGLRSRRSKPEVLLTLNWFNGMLVLEKVQRWFKLPLKP